MIPIWWSVLLTATGVLGLWLAGQRNAWGWAVGLAAQLLWVAYAIATEQWGFLGSALVYGAVYGRNLHRWRHPPTDRGDQMPFTWPWLTRRELKILAADIADQITTLRTTITEEIHIMAEQTTAAFAELRASIVEVAGEFDAIADKLDVAIAAGEVIDAETAAEIRTYAAQLRDLRPDAIADPVAGEPAPAGSEVPTPGPAQGADEAGAAEKPADPAV